jgi:hypothetical protein
VPSIPVSAFISHAYKERETAGKLRDELEDYHIQGFVAHDDIIGGEVWLNSLYREIKNCDAFVVFLSRAFHAADFTDHEVGIAYALKKPIIPVSLDDTLPYGFISKYQSVRIKEGITGETIEVLAHTIYLTLWKNGNNLLEELIDAFVDSNTFVQANKMATLLFTYEEYFNKGYVNDIVEAYFENSQIRGAFKAKRYIEKLCKVREKDLTPENKAKLSKLQSETKKR